ncbi:FUSC family protein [Pseudofrankia sp. BMG5.36]|uniref:FUSC family protein n=1 Tax=Pseudofrankia sp. BMG5.36 TaxID=1834512 RepID=UPI00104216D0|nr:FUSC family protein [Pseudofrankia sp. BMG5.36]
MTALAAALRGGVPAAAVAMAAVLASFGSALEVERAAHLGLGVVVQAVVLALTLARVERTRASRAAALGRARAPMALRLALLPVVAVVASEVGRLMVEHPNVGDTLFVLGISAGIWVRRFGPAASRLGTLATLPFIALLITPAVAAPDGSTRWWSALMAMIASFWVLTLNALAERIRLLPSPAAADGVTAAAPAAPAAPVTPAAPAPPSPRARKAGPAPASRMAAQMAVGLGAAFLVGRVAFPDHWPWLVVTAYIVAAGNRGRGDVAVKSVARLAGGAVGTAVATAVVAAAPAHSAWTVVAIFLVLAGALCLRTVHYAFWAAGVTAVLALLYGYFGLTAGHMLAERLAAMAVGSVLAVAASWLVLPVRSRDFARSRLARALAALTDLLLAVARAETGPAAAHRAAFLDAVGELELIAGTLAARRLVWRVARRPAPYLADAVDAVRGCREPVDALALAAADAPAALAAGAARRRAGGLARRIGSVRRSIAGRPEPANAVPAQRPEPPAGEPGPLDAAFDELAEAVAVLSAVFPPPPAPSEPDGSSDRLGQAPAGTSARAPAAPAASGAPSGSGAGSSAG